MQVLQAPKNGLSAVGRWQAHRVEFELSCGCHVVATDAQLAAACVTRTGLCDAFMALLRDHVCPRGAPPALPAR